MEQATRSRLFRSSPPTFLVRHCSGNYCADPGPCPRPPRIPPTRAYSRCGGEYLTIRIKTIGNNFIKTGSCQPGKWDHKETYELRKDAPPMLNVALDATRTLPTESFNVRSRSWTSRRKSGPMLYGFGSTDRMLRYTNKSSNFGSFACDTHVHFADPFSLA